MTELISRDGQNNQISARFKSALKNLLQKFQGLTQKQLLGAELTEEYMPLAK
jgi:hypothetical protein